jgi:phosphoglycerate kinase
MTAAPATIRASQLPSIERVDVAGARVLVRADLNVPITGDGRVADKTRMQRFASTVHRLVERRARVIIMSHLGRPRARDQRYSLEVIVHDLELALKQSVTFVSDCIGHAAEQAVASVARGCVVLLENLRFHRGEEENDRNFAEALARLGDLYVNDAFSCSHRAHASMHAITWAIPAFAGPSLLAEVEALEAAIESPKRPIMAVVGGSKVSSKLAILQNLAARVDALVICGGMANTFLAARGIDVGRSLAERNLIDTARMIEETARRAGCQIILPVDAIVADRIETGARHALTRIETIPQDKMILDIGPQTVADVRAHLQRCRVVLWNGPLGVFEIEPFDAGTKAVAETAAALTETGKLISVAGGGDTVAALNAAGVGKRFTYLSTGGGAFLEWLEGKQLPGIVALSRQTK